MITIQKASEKDLDLILEFIKKLADYENLSSSVVATKELLKENLFIKQKAYVLIAYYDLKPVGFALYFNNFSTFLGKCGIYLEDLFVDVEYRNKGIGKALIKELAKIANQNDYERIDWVCLKDNYPSLEVYKKIGANTKDEWLLHRLEKSDINNLLNNK
ncbi:MULTISPECIES: GNAT family N-acetyltransferase [unclassified Campylobacter]|uniref:GNAT family N-acetyltransferase n=1 Tax=unclassified Campylobacter TaxID=2593542 RepID=UPI001BD96402|nr:MULTISPECIES: GNAT family N-acetyltransferase [unclassified Campylobacter]MBZ7975655.1 GNAT family N-acetyltransferase [Campylobacter sp. RM12637]MBZ7977338.1 GNAT family N-acetyltransferase [Campylobacter sp. RM12654]MBZ7980501.1 GNAT family N-acetyltransferase [Campylobacter sp. RM12642]MBZ7980944.1 GNAT family N-acetyltransferase [Campylobacter sp. RM12640]MBZ7988263.1 GNAT family N-acetyltransferase [Campylobacter sp. RM12635]MBZ7991427.1 GNAT family N-acetyltransferase [Campylobacter 